MLIINVSSRFLLLLTQCKYINYMAITGICILYLFIRIYIHTHIHTSIYVHAHTPIAVHVYITFHLFMEGGMVRVYRILRIMSQSAVNIAKFCFVTNYCKVRNYNFWNSNILCHLLGGIYGARKDEHQGCSYFPPSKYFGSFWISTIRTFYYCYHVKCLIHDVCKVRWLVQTKKETTSTCSLPGP